jgi:molybdopterin/thiamine biosynthesis adenylyltransferase
VNEWLSCGKDILRRERDFRVSFEEAANLATSERVIQLLGEQAPQRLKLSAIGIVGCSGLGSPAAHILARAGVGKFVLVDSGCWKASGLERNHASRASDLSQPAQPKVEMLKRLIQEIRPETEVVAIAADVLDDRAVDELTRCDLILGCTDSYYARAALGDFATNYLVPVLDLAVQMDARDGRLVGQVGEIARYLPGLPCPWCRNRVTAAAIRAETATDAEQQQAEQAGAAAVARGEDGAQYWIGPRRQELTIGYMTTLVAAMGAGYTHNWLTGASELPHDRFQFDLGSRNLGFAEDVREPQADCSCQRCIGWADQGRADFTVSMPRIAT